MKREGGGTWGVAGSAVERKTGGGKACPRGDTQDPEERVCGREEMWSWASSWGDLWKRPSHFISETENKAEAHIGQVSRWSQ